MVIVEYISKIITDINYLAMYYFTIMVYNINCSMLKIPFNMHKTTRFLSKSLGVSNEGQKYNELS